LNKSGMRVTGYSTDLGDGGIREAQLRQWVNKWRAPRKPVSPGGPGGPGAGTVSSDDPYAQYAIQYGENFMEVLQSIPPWCQKSESIIAELMAQFAAAGSIEFPPGNRLVTRETIHLIQQLMNDIKVWESFSTNELARLEAMKAPPPPFPWNESVFNRLHDLIVKSRRSWNDAVSIISNEAGVFTTVEEAKARYAEWKVSNAGDTVPPVTASMPPSIGIRRVSEGHGQVDMPEDDSKEEQMKAGKKVEEEHSPTLKKILEDIEDGKLNMSAEEFYSAIANDHLKEHPDYYTRLLDMETQAKKEE